MFRWIFVCLLLSAGAVAAVWAVAPNTIVEPGAGEKPAPEQKPPEIGKALLEPGPAGKQPPVVSGPRSIELIQYAVQKQPTAPEPISIPGAKLTIVQQQEVPSEKEGKLLFIGTDLLPGEVVPPEKRLPEALLGNLVVPVAPNEKLLEGEEAFPLNPNTPTLLYRRVRDAEEIKPNTVILVTERRKVRKLQVGDKVTRGQLLALVNPRRAFGEVASRVAKLNAAESDRIGSMEQKKDMEKRHRRHLELNRGAGGGTVSLEEMQTTLTQLAKFASEEKVKAGEVIKAQSDLSTALTDLKMHEIRAAIDGIVRVIYKNIEGEAVKQDEAILQIQNPERLRAEGRLPVQEATKLKVGMEVIIEASRWEHPRLVISGHLGTVNCVAVSKGIRPVVVSGSEDETLRGWDSLTGDKLWQLRGLKSAVRSATCTPPGSKRNLVLFGCADGTIHLLDLDKINTDEKSRELSERHQGSVNSVAFSPDGEVCATGSDDYSICLWKTETGELLHRFTQAHRGPVTSVQFASAKLLVSAGRDKRLAVWDVESGKPPHRTSPNFEGRGGEVAQIGVSPDGRFVLFDQGKELRLLSLTDKQIEGTLQNPSEAMNFSTMALFSPDGKTILTNGAAAGKLQLWRTPVQARASELRQFIWKAPATCGAFAPEGKTFVVTGTQDHQVLVWTMPEKDEVETPLKANLTLVEKQLDTQSRQVRVWAEVQNPGWLIPGSPATIVVPPQK